MDRRVELRFTHARSVTVWRYPSLHQSGEGFAYDGRIKMQDHGLTRGKYVEAALFVSAMPTYQNGRSIAAGSTRDARDNESRFDVIPAWLCCTKRLKDRLPLSSDGLIRRAL